jgi:hypothetical protein
MIKLKKINLWGNMTVDKSTKLYVKLTFHLL